MQGAAAGLDSRRIRASVVTTAARYPIPPICGGSEVAPKGEIVNAYSFSTRPRYARNEVHPVIARSRP
jgi:hypothetical protein